MKRLFLGLTVLMFLLSAMAVSAVTLGDDNIKASNIQEDRDEFREVSIANVNITSGTVCTTVDRDSKYLDESITLRRANNLALSYTTASGRVTVKGRIPENLDSVDRVTGLERSFKVASFVCKNNDTTVFQDDIFMQRKNMFSLKKIYASYDSFEETLSEDGDSLEDLRPGTTVSLEVEGENLYNDNEDIDLSMTVKVVFDDSDIDFDEDDDLDVSADDTDSVSFDIELDEDDVEDKKYTGQVTVFGEDDYGAYHGEEWEIEFDVFKEKYEISITSFVSTSSITCDQRQLDLQVRLKNTGKNDDDQFKVEVAAPSLGINDKVDNINLDETDETTKTFSFTIKDDAQAITHKVSARAFVRGISLSDQEIIDVIVPECKPTQPQTPVQQPVVQQPVVQQPTAPVQQPVVTNGQQTDRPGVSITPRPPQTAQESEEEADEPEVTDDEAAAPASLYVVLLVVLIVVLLGGVIGLLVYLMKPSN